MNWFTKAFTSTVGRKLVMALTGLFLCVFLVVHVSGNFQLFKDDGGLAFNNYSVFMTHNPLIKTVSYLLYATFLLHIFQSLLLTLHNRKSRPVGYQKNTPQANSAWSSRNMGILGTVILVFLVVHMNDFWFEYKFGEIPFKAYYEVSLQGETKTFEKSQEMSAFINSIQEKKRNEFFEKYKKQGIDLNQQIADQKLYEKISAEYSDFMAASKPEVKTISVKDLYAEVAESFKQPWIVALYLLAMLALSFHLIHGFQSAWQTIGVNHRKYVPVIKAIGWFFSIVIPAGFAAMPIYFFLNS